MTVLAPAEDASPANWVVTSVTTFAESVNSLVPAGFEAYVRIFHPAWRDGRPLRWSEIAAEHGRVAHAGMQLAALTGHIRFENAFDTEFFDRHPELGNLPTDLTETVSRILASHTSTPEDCRFAVWEGLGALRGDVRTAPTFELPQRKYHLLVGPATGASEPVEVAPWWRTANLWWPHDRAWFVATEIDSN